MLGACEKRRTRPSMINATQLSHIASSDDVKLSTDYYGTFEAGRAQLQSNGMCGMCGISCRTAVAVAVAKSYMQCTPRSCSDPDTTPFVLTNRSYLCSTKGGSTLYQSVACRRLRGSHSKANSQLHRAPNMPPCMH